MKRQQRRLDQQLRGSVARRGAAWLAATVLFAGSISGCGTGASSSDVIRVFGGEPQNKLLSTNTVEDLGGRVAELLYTGLYSYNTAGQEIPEMVDKLETPDNKFYTISIKKGWKFHDGTEITAKDYIDTWNFGAYAKNAQAAQSYYSAIKGYKEVSGENPTATTLSGLKLINNTTFTVTLNQPTLDFKMSLGILPFRPMPAAAFTDPKKFGERPIGNGPYKFASWKHNESIELAPNKEYIGTVIAKNKGISFKSYTTLDAAYSDLQGGNLEVMDTIPASALATYKKDRSVDYQTKEVATNSQIQIPMYLPHFSGEEGRLRRQAISMAINRQEIMDKIFYGIHKAAEDFTSPVLNGFNPKVPGNEVLKFNPERAKQLWGQANSLSPWTGTFKISFNKDGGHATWIEALLHSITNTLGIATEPDQIAQFGELRNMAVSGKLKAGIRSGWQADYPSILQFLEPNYTTRASNNDARYSNPEFDQLLLDAEKELSLAAALPKIVAAQTILLNDLPAIPIYQRVQVSAFARGTTGEVMWNGMINYAAVTK